jgi:hypothetical protein
MSFLSALDFQKRPAAPDFKNQPETALAGLQSACDELIDKGAIITGE